jgi:hypothetical protein
LIWQATQIAEPARTWIATTRIEDALTEPPKRGAAVVPGAAKHDGVLAQLKAKPLRGDPGGSALT